MEGIHIMNLSFHGQSTIYFESNGKKVIVDPFITGNSQSDLNVDTLEVDYIILTHGHGDHFGDTVEIANRNHATVIGSAELGRSEERRVGKECRDRRWRDEYRK